MRYFLVDLLVREFGCHVATEDPGSRPIANGHIRAGDLLLIDQGKFAMSDWRDAASQAGARVLVVGPEDDTSAREAASALGADAWLAREQLGEHLGAAMLRALEPPPRLTTEGVA